MTYSAVFMGSLGVIAETSELQRLSYNAAFERLGLDWVWGKLEYLEMLKVPGGRARIARAAEAAGLCDAVDIGAAYRLKRGAFRSLVQDKGIVPRRGVVEFLAEARAQGMRTGFVTSTPYDQVQTLFDGLRGQLTRDDFDYVGQRDFVPRPKPAPDIYQHALAELELAPRQVLAVEDTPESAEAAQAAGINVVGFPGLAARGRAFPEGVPVLEFLSPAILMRRAALEFAAE